MSYDIRLRDRRGETVILDEPHYERGGTYVSGGTRSAELNITYNYGSVLREVLGPDGVRWLYGKRAEDTIYMLESAISRLGDNVDHDYWAPTEGNVKQALRSLLKLAKLAPHGVWEGD